MTMGRGHALLIAALFCVPQARSLYVVQVVGPWVAVQGRDTIELAALSRVPGEATIAYVGDDPQDPKASIILRDPRTLGKAQWQCGKQVRCDRGIAVSQLRFAVASSVGRAAATELATRLGDQESLRERIRLVGARAEARDAGLVVLSTTPNLSVLTTGTDPAGLIARFCGLQSGSGDDPCLTDRRLLPNDCPVAAPCTLAPGAYRVDLYRKERSMLSTVAVVGGVAVVVPEARKPAVEREVARLLASLRPVRAEFGDDEWRGLLGSIAVGLKTSPE